MKKYFEANRKMWDEFAKAHFTLDNEYYSVKSFLEGNTSLRQYELMEVGDVKDKKILHLQCHFGLDTLSWAREGAEVTGIDFSVEAIRLAKELSQQANIDANFIQTNLYDLQDDLVGEFDIVYTSIGVLCWLPDLKKWAEIIAKYLKPGGFFYINDGHPFSHVFDGDNEKELQVKYDYFRSKDPIEDIADGSYATEIADMEPHVEYEWNHSLSEIINSLIKAGLSIDFLNEHPFTAMKHYKFSERDAQGYYRLKKQKTEIPLTFSLKASKII